MLKYLKKIEKVYKKGGPRAAFFIGGIAFFLVASSLFFYNVYCLPKKPVVIYVKKGTSHQSFAALLARRNIINQTFLVRAALFIFSAKLKHGEFLLPACASLRDIILIVTRGAAYQRFITFPEGITASETCKILDKMPGLVGECPCNLKEGSILPNTYAYFWGEDKNSLVLRCTTAMKRKILTLWEKRSKDIPLSTPEELITLASIVEKETAKPEERPIVAAVFLNRLKKGMPLQADPTVLYGVNQKRLSQGKELKKILSKEDLKEEKNLYNTYKRKGLPPSPIAHPGSASLEAVIKPSKEEYLYFVANNKGGHIFSTKIEDHIRHHKQWRKYKKLNREKKIGA